MKYILVLLCSLAGSIYAADGLHPFFSLENVYPSNKVELKCGAMHFEGNDLYIVLNSPNRTNKEPFYDGEVVKVTGLIGNSDRSKIKSEVIFNKLYEPMALTIHKGVIYIGEKDKISRLEDKNGDGKYSQDEKVVLIDGLSQPNFHTYTIGFEKLKQDGKTYLVGNLTTSIRLGGKREYNITINPKTRRGSTFIFGPITGKETKDNVDIQYLSGGYRTPNGIGLGKDQAVFVTDNQGIFNPANKFIRVTPGAFYGHYLMKREDSNIAAYQPENIDSIKGSPSGQTPATVYLPQGSVARSPGQPLMFKSLTGEAAAYNGQFIIPDITLGRTYRVFTEKVKGTWQGAVFIHSTGMDEKGVNGFTAGPNRILEGPDKNYYIGHIGAGGLWGVKNKPWFGLQRMSQKKDLPKDFNEMLAVRDHEKGLEIEFIRPMPADALTAANFQAQQWTYIPTSGYGGRNQAQQKLSITGVQVLEGGKKVLLEMKGIRSNAPPWVQGKGKAKSYSNKNVGWVIQVDYKAKSPVLWNKTFWYTMIKHKGETAKDPIKNLDIKDPMKLAESIHTNVCKACHSTDGTKILGPTFKGMFGRKQTIIRSGKEVQVTIDEDYLKQSIDNPLYEHPKGYLPAMPNPGLSSKERDALIQWIKKL